MDHRRIFSLCALSLLLALLVFSAAAAQPLPGALAGTVRDSLRRQPVPYATVRLLPAAPGAAPVAGTTADAQGRFRLAQLAAGAFRLQVSFVGYAVHSQAVMIERGPVSLPPVYLAPAAQQLGEAVVVGTRPLVDVRPDRLVYHADQDLGNAGATAADVLRKTPLLAVDGLGNVTLRGTANFKVLVNDKPAPALAQNLAQALRSIPADQIQRVEVLTTPGARYDGEGAGGLVNIVLKKNAQRTANGRLGASGGNRTAELTSALNFRRGKLGVSAAASAGRWFEPDQLDRRRLGFTALGPDTLTQSGRRWNTGAWGYAALGLDYDPAPRHSFSLSGTLNGYRAQSQRDLFTRFAAPDAALNQRFTRATADFGGNLSTEATGTYTRTFAQARREWSVLGQYARNAGTFGYDADQYPNAAVALGPALASYRERSRGRTPSQEATAQSDFTQPFGEKNTLQAGVKAIFRRTGAVAAVDGFTPGQGPDFAPLPGRATDFSYAQNVQAAYASYAGAWGKKLTATLGGRVERTALVADFCATGTGFSRQYGALLPTGSVQYAFSDTSGLRLAYGRRITRPAIDYLNPFVDRSNPQAITYGNPDLDPELTDTYEASYTATRHGAQLVLTGAVRHTGNAIEALRLPTGTAGVSAQTFANVAANTAYQLTLYGSAKPAPHWQLSGGPNAQYLVLRSPALGIARQGVSAGVSVDTSYSLPNKVSVQAAFAGALPAPTLQGQGAASLYYSAGVKKTLLHDQADVTLNVANPFTGSFPNRTSLATAFLDERTTYRTYPRAVRLSVSYRLGQEGPERARKQVKNDDRK
ncbi:MAG: TonB-dependent receptor domain-containing protein [Janthinobacterium lividum]